MKRMLSLITIMCMLLTCIAMPVSATNAELTVTLSGIADGDIYESGSNIIISAQTNMADVKNIDIYANGDKLPGTVIGSSGTYIWYAPASGNYAVKAIAATSENAAAAESDAINIVVKSNPSPRAVMSQFNSFEDMANWTKGDVPVREIDKSDVSADYAAFSPYSFKVTGPEAYSIYLENPTATSMTSGDYIVVPFYNASDIEGIKFGLTTNKWGVGSGVGASTSFTLKKGWNFPRLSINYSGGVSSSFVNLRGNGFGGEYLVANHGIIELYVNGVYVVNNANSFVSQTLEAVSTSIPDGQGDVCNNLKTYRISFNEQIIADADAVAVTKVADDGTETAVEGYTVTAGNDYIDVAFEEGALEFGAKYKVAVNNTVVDVLGLNFKGAEYTFSTIADDCTSVKPILDIVYPAEGASVGTSTAVVAKVTFPSAITGVEFTTASGEPVAAAAYSSGEYAVNLTGLTAGEVITVTATATLADESTISDSVTITPTESTSYALWGMGDSDYVFASSGDYRNISVLVNDENTLPGTKQPGGKGAWKSVFTKTYPTDVAYAEFFLDGVSKHRATASPYSWDMPLDKLGEQTLTVNVVSNTGALTAFTKEFTVIAGSKLAEYTNDYTDGVVPTWNNAEGTYENVTIKQIVQADGTTGNVLNIGFANVPAKTKPVAPIFKLDSLGDGTGVIVHAEFDLVFNDQSGWRFLTYDTAGSQRALQTGKKANGGTWQSTKSGNPYWRHIELDYYPEKGLSVAYVDGIEYRRMTNITNSVDAGTLCLNYFSSDYVSSTETADFADACYVDNLEAYAYTVLGDGCYVDREGSSVTVYNNANSPESIAVFEAAFTAEGESKRLDSATMTPISLPAYGIFKNTYTVPAGSSLFVWDGETLAPLAEALEN